MATRVIPLVPARPAVLPEALEFRISPPLSLYVHVPWCVHKCGYCDFNSHVLNGDLPEKTYLDALLADVESALPLVWGRPVVSVFFGGGTPSLLSPEGIDALLARLRALLPILPEAEITLEANPGTVDGARFQGFAQAGINRLSLGVQSFDDGALKALDRIHDSRAAHQAADAARQYFARLNLDLMLGLPGQGAADVLADLAAACQHAPDHLSHYALTLEAHTRFAAFPPPALPDDDCVANWQDEAEKWLLGAGFQHYETSAFALPGARCQHNGNYWHFGDYLGIGAGAHSKLTLHDRVLRQMRHKHPQAYLQAAGRGAPLAEEHAVAVADLPLEFLMNALRLFDGFPPALFEARTGCPFAVLQAPIARAEAAGLLTYGMLEGQGHVQPSALGRRFLNRLLELFMA